MGQEKIGRPGGSDSRGITTSDREEEGFINKLLSCRNLIILVGIRLKQKVEDRVPAVFRLSNTFLAACLDLMDPLCALLAAR